MLFKHNPFYANVFTPSYMLHIQNVQTTQGYTVGEKAGYGPDNAKRYAPIVTTSDLYPPSTVNRMAGPSSYALVPSRPFLASESDYDMVSDSDGGGFTEILPAGTNNYILPGILASLLFMLSMF